MDNHMNNNDKTMKVIILFRSQHPQCQTNLLSPICHQKRLLYSLKVVIRNQILRSGIFHKPSLPSFLGFSPRRHQCMGRLVAIGKSPLGVVGFLPFGRLPIIQPSLGITDLKCGHLLSCEIKFGVWHFRGGKDKIFPGSTFLQNSSPRFCS